MVSLFHPWHKFTYIYLYVPFITYNYLYLPFITYNYLELPIFTYYTFIYRYYYIVTYKFIIAYSYILPMVTYIFCLLTWLVVGPPLWKNMSSSIGMIHYSISFPRDAKIKFMAAKTTNQGTYFSDLPLIYHWFTIFLWGVTNPGHPFFDRSDPGRIRSAWRQKNLAQLVTSVETLPAAFSSRDPGVGIFFFEGRCG